jgi:hypothetical protein
MIANFAIHGNDPVNHGFCLVVNHLADHKEGGYHTVFFEFIQDQRRQLGIRAVVECQGAKFIGFGIRFHALAGDYNGGDGKNKK